MMCVLERVLRVTVSLLLTNPASTGRKKEDSRSISCCGRLGRL